VYPPRAWFVSGICVWIPCINETMMMLLLMMIIIIIEVQITWNTKPKVTPIITGITGTISKLFRKHPSTMSRNYT
jgi:hypothetical protein